MTTRRRATNDSRNTDNRKKKKMKLKVGDAVVYCNRNGFTSPGKVSKVNGDLITVDVEGYDFDKIVVHQNNTPNVSADWLATTE